MNCQKFETVVDELARDQIMEAVTREEAIVHSASCEMCSLRLRDERALTEGLRQMAAMMENESAPPAIEAIETRLAVEFRNYHGARKGAVAVVPLAAKGRRVRRSYWNYAAAAVILMALALGVVANRFWRSEFSNGGNGSGETLPAAKLAANTPVPVNSPDANVPLPPEAPSKRVAQVNSRRSPVRSFRSRVARTSVTVQSLAIIDPAAEVTTEFIPIAYSSAANIQEGGQLMRLELPRYAMARFGVPINEERYDERVKADIWFGADGLARAIRFVQ